ncbi:MAG: AAA family ATPase [Bacteroidetes bacterium 4572_114]|nr:MAG: AAA family ATPase [Bacteroidetes bacterium 4572_114]
MLKHNSLLAYYSLKHNSLLAFYVKLFKMEREITHSLVDWKNRAKRKPILFRGARQVGKTYTVEEFARNHFTNFLKINLELQKDICPLLTSTNSIKSLITELGLYFDIEIIPGKTLLFIDEIQSCPEAIALLRYFYEEMPELHVIAAGSLLDHTLSEMKYSMPVGRIEFLYMYPMSFKEFLIVSGGRKLISYLEAYKPGEAFSELLHRKLIEYLRIYFFVGGMPEAVKYYISDGKLNETSRIHNEIITSLKYDFAKYGTRKQQEYLELVMLYSAKNVGNKVKYSNISKEIRSLNLKEAFHKLELSRIIHLIRYSNAGGVPLSNHNKDDIFKPLFFDIGLVNTIGKIQLINIQKLITMNEGALAEQFIGQELLTAEKTYIDPQLFYWIREKKNSNAEVDYIFQHNNKIYPIEVKAGKTGSLKSLHVYLLEKKFHTGIRFNLDMPNYGNFSTKVRIGNSTEELNYNLISLPLYMCFVLPEIIDSSPFSGVQQIAQTNVSSIK